MEAGNQNVKGKAKHVQLSLLSLQTTLSFFFSYFQGSMLVCFLANCSICVYVFVKWEWVCGCLLSVSIYMFLWYVSVYVFVNCMC